MLPSVRNPGVIHYLSGTQPYFADPRVDRGRRCDVGIRHREQRFQCREVMGGVEIHVRCVVGCSMYKHMRPTAEMTTGIRYLTSLVCYREPHHHAIELCQRRAKCKCIHQYLMPRSERHVSWPSPPSWPGACFPSQPSVQSPHTTS
jgi:hypothetical protein